MTEPVKMVLVPAEPTEAMINAWRSAFADQCHKRRGKGSPRGAGDFRRAKHPDSAELVAYRAMLKAAPKPAGHLDLEISGNLADVRAAGEGLKSLGNAVIAASTIRDDFAVSFSHPLKFQEPNNA